MRQTLFIFALLSANLILSQTNKLKIQSGSTVPKVTIAGTDSGLVKKDKLLSDAKFTFSENNTLRIISYETTFNDESHTSFFSCFGNTICKSAVEEIKKVTKTTTLRIFNIDCLSPAKDTIRLNNIVLTISP